MQSNTSFDINQKNADGSSRYITFNSKIYGDVDYDNVYEKVKYIYDYIIKNSVLEDAVSDVMSIIRAGQLEISKMKNKISEVITNA